MFTWISGTAWNDLQRRLAVLEKREPPKADAAKLADTLGWVKLAADEQMPFAAAVALNRLMELLGHAFGWQIDFILGAPAAGKTAEEFLIELSQASDADQPA
ncbi:MAG: hypothetical protein WAS73_01175 [Defluviicoccus sp.]